MKQAKKMRKIFIAALQQALFLILSILKSCYFLSKEGPNRKVNLSNLFDIDLNKLFI